MSTLSETVKRLSSFDFEKSILKVYKDNDNIILDLNTDSQLGEKGINADGSKIIPGYTETTQGIKLGLGVGFGKIVDHVTLFNEGNFHKSFFLDASKFPLIIDAADEKKEEIIFKYGDEFFGLTKESMQELKEQLIDEIQEANRKGIGI